MAESYSGFSLQDSKPLNPDKHLTPRRPSPSEHPRQSLAAPRTVMHIYKDDPSLSKFTHPTPFITLSLHDLSTCYKPPSYLRKRFSQPVSWSPIPFFLPRAPYRRVLRTALSPLYTKRLFAVVLVSVSTSE